MIVYGDIEEALRVYLGGDTYVGVPKTRQGAFTSLLRIGGPKRDIVTDSPTVQFECWAPTGSAAHALAQTVRAKVHDLKGTTISGITVYRVQEFAGPANVPDPESDQPRYVFTASLDVRYPD